MRPSPLPHTLYAISQQFYSNASSSTDFSVSADLCNALIPYSPSIIVEIGSIERSSLIIASHILFTDIAIP